MSSASVDEQRQIADGLIGFSFASEQKHEVGERIRYEFQRFGFFKVRVSELTVEGQDNARPPTVSVIARIEEGNRYRLKSITFTGNKAVFDSTNLRSVFPLRDGEIFDRQKFAEGLEDLRSGYGELGFINMTAVPEPTIDEENTSIAVRVAVDEGTQFVIKSVTVQDPDPQRQAALRALWSVSLEPGMIFNARLVKVFFEQARAQKLMSPEATPERNLTMNQNLEERSLDIVVNTQ